MILTVHVKPNSRETGVVSWLDGSTVKIDLHAPPVDGEANQELISFLAKRLNLAKSLVEIRRGQGSRVKHVRLPDKTDLSPLTNY